MIAGFALIVLGGVLFAAGLTAENRWLIAPGLVLLPLGVIWGLRRAD